MKTLKVVLIMCMMMFAYNNVEVNAQAAAKAGKYVKELVKGVSKTKGKRTGVKPAKSSTVPPKRIIMVECSTCKGKGKVNVWNRYSGYWEEQKCVKCNGTGRVKHNH